ncbi:2'-5' RNA ligase [Bosea sp. LC85]|uniref:2'-5' RNA ligase family protein n=1 Tax=Bosea sp. LC85 TaxID=1502851 RepID=UPI0004E424DC|nr:2'-5' RNA ligase family protein [Bosea sp. LC85]KFC69060.1 2'-5' RNA ligase [Bosea sp. LC85]
MTPVDVCDLPMPDLSLPQNLRGPPRAGSRESVAIFFALLPEPDTASNIAHLAGDLRAEFNLHGRLRPTRLLHVSLNKVGNFIELPEEIVAAALEAGRMVEAHQFAVSLDRFLSFSGGEPHAFVLCCGEDLAALSTLRRNIDRALKRVGLKPGGQAGSTPHVTILYDRELVPSMGLERPIGWVARDFVLIESFQGQSRYEILGRWPLHPLC